MNFGNFRVKCDEIDNLMDQNDICTKVTFSLSVMCKLYNDNFTTFEQKVTDCYL